MATLQRYDMPKTSIKWAAYSDSDLQEFLTTWCDFYEDNGFPQVSSNFDPTTATVDGMTSYIGGSYWEIRRFSGPLQSSTPIYMRFTFVKLESGNYDTLRIEFSNTSSFSTILLTVQHREYQYQVSEGTAPTNNMAFVAIENEYMAFVSNNNGYHAGFAIGRLVDSAGERSTEGFYYMLFKYNATFEVDINPGAYDYSVNTYATSNTGNGFFSVGTLGNTTSPNPLEAVLLSRLWANPKTPVPIPDALVGYQTEWAANSEITVANVGDTPMTFKQVFAPAFKASGAPSPTHKLLLRWE